MVPETELKGNEIGAYEYIEKPFDIPKLIFVIEEALKNSAADKGEIVEPNLKQK